MPPVITALAGICIGKLRINDARARDWPHSHSLSKPRHSAILLFLLSECFNESLSPLFFATTRATLRGIYHRVYKWENGEEMRLYTAFPEIFWFLEDKKRGFNKSYLQSVSSIREITFREKRKYNINEKRTRITHINCLNVILNKLLSCSRREYLGARKRLKRRRLLDEKNVVDWWRKYLEEK